MKKLQPVLPLLGALFLPLQASANQALLDQGMSLLQQGKLDTASQTFNKVLLEDQENIDAILGLATISAWSGRYDEGERRYMRVLDRDPNHVQALIGLGYTLGWAGDYQRAESYFARAGQVAPGNVDAEKGSAFVALWSKDAASAEARFTRLVAEDPANTELLVALGQAHLQANDSELAAASFDRVLALEPDNRAALSGLRSSYSLTSRLEANLLFGDNEDESGLRQLEVGSWLSNATRVWLRYDDSLSMDAPDLTRGDSETRIAGVHHQFDQRWMGRFELGARDLPDGNSQDVRAFEVTRLSAGPVYKLGLQSAPHSDGYDDRLVYFGAGLPVNSNWSVEPMLYLAESGADSDDSWRLLGRATFQGRGLWSLDLGLGFGHADSQLDEFEGDVTVASAQWNRPISSHYRVSLQAIREDAPGNELNSLYFQLGMKL